MVERSKNELHREASNNCPTHSMAQRCCIHKRDQAQVEPKICLSLNMFILNFIFCHEMAIAVGKGLNPNILTTLGSTFQRFTTGSWVSMSQLHRHAPDTYPAF